MFEIFLDNWPYALAGIVAGLALCMLIEQLRDIYNRRR